MNGSSSSLRVFFLLLICSFLSGNFVWSDEGSCEGYFAQLNPVFHQLAEEIREHYDPKNPIPTWVVPINQMRDRLRGLFQILHEGDYPIIALDDATPVNAYALATDAFQKLPETQKDLVDIVAIKAQLAQLLDRVETYPDTLREFLDETTNLASEERILAEILKSDRKPDFPTFLELPVIKTTQNEAIEVTSRHEYFSNEIQLLNTIKRIRRKLKDRNGARFFGLDESNNMAVAHAINVKKLETYMHEMKRAQSLNPGKNLPVDLQEFLSRIEALYTDRAQNQLQNQYKPPAWAKDRVHWMQLGGELRSVFEKDLPRLIDREQNQKIIEFIQHLSVEERRALGITDAAKAADILSRTKWISVIPLGSTLGGGAYEGALRAYDYFIADSKAKEHCASLVDDNLFIDCVQEYLQVRFPAQVIESYFKDQTAFLNPEGKITDAAVLSEIRDVMERRENLVHQDQYYKNARSQLSEFVGKLMGDYDKSSSQYRRKLVESSSDEAFYRGLLGQDKPYIPSYLYFNYPLDFKLYREKVEKIIRAEYDSDEQEKYIDELKRNAPHFADEIKSLLNERNRYKKWGGHESSIPKGWNSPWNTERGASSVPPIPAIPAIPGTGPVPDAGQTAAAPLNSNSAVLGNREGGRSTSILPWFWLRR